MYMHGTNPPRREFMRHIRALGAGLVVALIGGVVLASPTAASPATQSEKPLVIIEMYGRST
jgi:hypothetical protein